MARKKSMFRKLMVLGGAAAAGWTIYKNRELLRSFAEALSTPAKAADKAPFPEEAARDFADEVKEPAPVEAQIVIDNTKEDTGEA